MIAIKTENDIQKMKRAGRLTLEALHAARDLIAPGVTTARLDKAVHDYIISHGGVPSFLGYGGFPASACISVNEVVIHGIPGGKVLACGDVVSLDVGAKIGGFHGDCARTYAVGEVSAEAKKLIEVTKNSFFEALKVVRAGNRIGDIGAAVSAYAESFGFSVVRDFTGHGIGREMHEDPAVPNFGSAGRGVRLLPGMVIAIEPMICAGDYNVSILADRWTTVTADGALSAHYENTVAVTENEAEILTSCEVPYGDN